MRIPIGLLALILLWLAMPGTAAAATQPACTVSHATAATIEAVRGDYRAWRGRCVTLRGLAIGNRLFADRHALLEASEIFGETIRHSIVLYDGRNIRPGRKPALAEVTGTIGSCAEANADIAALQAQSPGEIIMLGGYCHTSMETFVAPTAIRIVSRAPVPRLTEAEVPETARLLVDAPRDAPNRARLVEAARALAVAMREGDEAAYGRLTNPDIQDGLSELAGRKREPWLRRDLREAHAAFVAQAALRRRLAALPAPEAWQERVLVDRADLTAWRTDHDEIASYVTCWCRTADCRGRWPVIVRDADNGPGRPYLCARSNDYVVGHGKTVAQARIVEQPEGFAEPAWPAPAAPPG